MSRLRLYLFPALLFWTATVTGAYAQSDTALRDAIDAHKFFIIEERCKLLSDAQMLLLRSDQEEKRARLAVIKPELLPQLDKANANWKELSRQIDCHRDLVLVDSRQLLNTRRSIFYIRAALALDLEKTTPYAANLTILSQHADRIHRVMNDIEERANLAPALPETIMLMGGLLRDLCQERKSIRWSEGERPCPTIKYSKEESAYGAQLLKNIETYIAADDIAPPPSVSYWTTSLSGPACRIERKIGNAAMSGTVTKERFFEFAMTVPVPESAIRRQGPAVQGGGQLVVDGHMLIGGLPSPMFSKLNFTAPGLGIAQGTEAKGEIATGSLKFPARILKDGLGIDTSSGGPGNPSVSDLGHLFFALVLGKPRLHGSDGTTEMEVDLSDMAAMTKATLKLHQAYAQCWP